MKKGLGRGLDSLFGNFDNEKEETKNTTSEVKNEAISEPSEIEIGLIDRNPEQPRKNFDEKALNELAISIKEHGVIQPIIVKKEGYRYTIIAGERRWRASRLAGLKTIPCLIKEYSDKQISEIAIIENLQREDLNPIESARAIKNLMNQYNMTQEEVADKIGKSRSAITNTLRLLNLPDSIINLVETDKLSAGHARALLGLEDVAKQKQIALVAVEKKLSVRDVENLVREAEKPIKHTEKIEKSLELKDFEQKIKRYLSTKVQIKGNDVKGKIIIDYYSKNDLDRIYELLKADD